MVVIVTAGTAGTTLSKGRNAGNKGESSWYALSRCAEEDHSRRSDAFCKEKGSRHLREIAKFGKRAVELVEARRGQGTFRRGW
jgi:hypothetical protein